MRFDFRPGDEIEFCGDRFIVVENHGDSGTVREAGEGGTTVTQFYWRFQGEECELVKRKGG